MTSDGHTHTWEFFVEAAAYDGSAGQIDGWAKRYSRNDILGGFGLVRDNKKEFLSRFSKNEMGNIVKATTLLEMVDKKTFGFGSVHPAILIIKLLRDDQPDECDKLDKWVLENSKNGYLPWGCHRSRFKSWQEVEEARARGRANAAAEEERQEVEHTAKLERDKAKAQHNIYNAIRRKDVGAIEAMIAKGVDLDKPNNEGKSPRAYAEELGNEKVLGALKA